MLYAILGCSSLSTAEFTSLVAPKLAELMESLDTQFIFSDNLPIFVVKYLSQRGFRACTMYHLGDAIRHNIGNYALRGGFSTYAEIEASLRVDADIILEF